MRLFSGIKRKELINLGLFAISLIPLLLYIFVVSQRIGLPFDLEWGEGAGINQIHRILSRDQLYGPPTLEFAPLVYTPIYYWLASLLAGLGLPITFAGRLLSLLASFGSSGMIGLLVIKETGDRFAGWLASALYLASFALSDGFFDLARVDSLYVFLLLVTFSMVRSGTKPAGKVAGGLAIALGFYVKQSALIVFTPLIVYLVVKDWKSNWQLLLTVILGILVPFYLIDNHTEGWFSYYILRLPQEHGYSMISAINYWIGDLARPLGIAIGIGSVYLLVHWRERISLWMGIGREEIEKTSKQDITKENNPEDMLFIVFALGAICASWITRASNGGGANNVMPAYAVISIFFGLGFSAFSDLTNGNKINSGLGTIILAGTAAIQFIGLIYNPFNFIPSTGEITANQDLLGYLSETEGMVWIPYRSHLPLLVGKPSSMHAVNLFELTGYFRGDVLPEGRDLVEQIRMNICDQSYDLVMLDQPIPWIEEQLLTAYEKADLFDYLEGERRSPALEWQEGYEAFYVPRPEYDSSTCFESFSGKENN